MRYIILITLIQLSCVVNIQAEEIKYNSEGLVFYNKGLNYLKGDGVPENHAKAIKFIRKAAELNNIGGQVFLGLFYSSGKVEGIELDYDEALKWFVKAIEQKTPVDALSEPSFKAEFTELKGIAQLNLGAMYHKGLGVTQDNIKATKLYEKSAGNGNAKASLAFWQLVKDIKKSQEIASIKSPDGLFVVSSKAVTKIKVTGSPNKNGFYPYDKISVRSTQSKYFKRGSVSSRGWWLPDTQQFYYTDWVIKPKTPQCNHWSGNKWSFSYIPIKIKIRGHEVGVWKSNHENLINNRIPKSYCTAGLTYPDTCKFKCNKWAKPGTNGYNYIVKSETDAVSLFNSLN